MKKNISKIIIIGTVLFVVSIIIIILFYLTEHREPSRFVERSAKNQLEQEHQLRFKRKSLDAAKILEEKKRFEKFRREKERFDRKQKHLEQQKTRLKQGQVEKEPQEWETKEQLDREHREAILTNTVDRILDAMELGTIAFNIPTEININDSPQIQLFLSLAESEEALKQSIIEEGKKIGASIKVSHRMEARLSGSMFQITAITSEIQAVTRGQRTEWKWEIHPKEQGRHKLHLTLTALLEIDGYCTPRTIKSFDKYIEVNVTSRQMLAILFKANWQWLWATTLVPLVGWLWRLRKKKQLTKRCT